MGDRNDNALRLHYDDAGRLVRITDSVQTLHVLLHYDERSHASRVSRIERRYGEALHASEVLVQYRYDAHHRLVEARVERPGMPERRYGYDYDALGRRTAKYQIDSDGQRHSHVQFLWDGLRMVRETQAQGNSVYLYKGAGSYEPVARLDAPSGAQASRTLYYHTDINGAPEELTDASGEIVWRTHYQVWGNTVVETAVEEYRPQQNLRYQGQYLDRETGLHYNLFRYYDPEVGRFVTPDPIGLTGGLNLYRYAPNPISWIDPWGLCPGNSKPSKNSPVDSVIAEKVNGKGNITSQHV
ncbi:RHS repeat domain-containing protein [Caballeronia sp. Sq4a]|uniref:RHS repeat domain-containing protein n=1 Tax=Caballeronia sp. Sq4a TaxID=2878152 RepID=UPI00352C6D77